MSDEVSVKVPFISFNIKKEFEIPLEVKNGQYLLKIWSWKKLGYVRKLLTVSDGKVDIKVLT